MPRSQMLELFRQDVSSVLFGTDSFWMGVDVPGEALSNVTIVKLPFPVPDHPLVAAREEMIVSRGGRAFWHYALPEAILAARLRSARARRDALESVARNLPGTAEAKAATKWLGLIREARRD